MPLTPSPLFVPPRYVANTSCDPAGLSAATNASTIEPLKDKSMPSAVTGKSNDPVLPPTQIVPSPPRATAAAPSKSDPPRKVENASPPAALSFATKASLPSSSVSNADGVVGKSIDGVDPTTYALPAASTAT